MRGYRFHGPLRSLATTLAWLSLEALRLARGAGSSVFRAPQ
jgi:hypothetical protein